MDQTPPGSDGQSLCMIKPFGEREGGLALAIWFKDKKITAMYSGPALDGHSFYIDDFTRTGAPDFIQFVDLKTNKVFEAFTIINGIVEPLPADQFKEDRSSFNFEDKKLVDFLKQKSKSQRS